MSTENIYRSGEVTRHIAMSYLFLEHFLSLYIFNIIILYWVNVDHGAITVGYMQPRQQDKNQIIV